MKRKISLVLFSFLFVAFISHGQSDFRNGYIITMEKDTTQGLLSYRSNAKNYESCIFKLNDEETEYYPSELIGFGYEDDKYFSSQIIEGTFVEVLVLGKMSLFRLHNKFHLRKDTSFFDLESNIVRIEENGKVGYEERGKWRGVLSYLSTDCEKNSSISTAGLKFDEKNLTNYVLKYNRCVGGEYTELKANKPWSKFNYGIILGVSQSEIKTSKGSDQILFEYLDDSYSSMDPTIGLLVELTFPRLSEKIAFQSEAHFIKSSFSSLVELENLTTRYHDTFIDLTTLSIPFSAKYKSPVKKYGWYVQLGINYDHHLSSQTRRLSEEVVGNVVNTSSESIVFSVNTHQFGYWGGIGLVKSFQKINASVAMRYNQIPSLSKTVGLTADNNRISLNLIIIKK